jgi:hypothetical protein
MCQYWGVREEGVRVYFFFKNLRGQLRVAKD